MTVGVDAVANNERRQLRHLEVVCCSVLAFVAPLAAHSLKLCACDAAACMHEPAPLLPPPQAHKVYLEGTEHRTAAFNKLTQGDADAARVIEQRMKQLHKLQVCVCQHVGCIWGCSRNVCACVVATVCDGFADRCWGSTLHTRRLGLRVQLVPALMLARARRHLNHACVGHGGPCAYAVWLSHVPAGGPPALAHQNRYEQPGVGGKPPSAPSCDQSASQHLGLPCIAGLRARAPAGHDSWGHASRLRWCAYACLSCVAVLTCLCDAMFLCAVAQRCAAA